MVEPSQSPSPTRSWAFSYPDTEKAIPSMMNVTAKPTWQWSDKNTTARSLSARSGNAGTSVLKQALMPRSLDVDFSLKYRR